MIESLARSIYDTSHEEGACRAHDPERETVVRRRRLAGREKRDGARRKDRRHPNEDAHPELAAIGGADQASGEEGSTVHTHRSGSKGSASFERLLRFELERPF